MRFMMGAVAACAGVLLLSGWAQEQQTEKPLPVWAYPVKATSPRVAGARPAAPAVPAEDAEMHVPGSSATYSKKAIPDLYTVPDWFPGDHPALPAIARDGRKPDVPSCGHCHLPNGFGRPENQSIAGLPKAYIIEQFADFKSGARHSSSPQLGSSAWMSRLSKNITPEEIEASATYFSSIKPTKWIRVVETDEVAKTHPDGLMLAVDTPKVMEPIGEKIVELPEDDAQFELRNPHVGFVAYVPKGTLAKGAALVKAGGCAACHGANLKGVGNVPSIAGRSPSQMGRQLIDFQRGNRSGAGAALMKAPVANLSDADVVAITGYLASLEP